MNIHVCTNVYETSPPICRPIISNKRQCEIHFPIFNIIQAYTDDKKRNSDVIDGIIRKEPDNSEDEQSNDTERYAKFLEALKKSGQEHMAAMMTNIHRELDLVDKCNICYI